MTQKTLAKESLPTPPTFAEVKQACSKAGVWVITDQDETLPDSVFYRIKGQTGILLRGGLTEEEQVLLASTILQQYLDNGPAFQQLAQPAEAPLADTPTAA